MPPSLTLDEVRHVARLARLRLSDDQLEAYRGQLATVLEHLRTIADLDVADVEPLAHPADLTNRLREDESGPALPVEALLRNAPAAENDYLAVPKVLAPDGGG
ncbi:MAG: Asp-tRNA(Asn)/Glu-tRNA(Gln) amidotransferase subunit GatC [Planctomycetota bacterium]|jgi:aspartyl-tRNA(Asn)/glutamyl-tRNA(Gln) amidotransferase subunit C